MLVFVGLFLQNVGTYVPVHTLSQPRTSISFFNLTSSSHLNRLYNAELVFNDELERISEDTIVTYFNSLRNT
jgi:hypothetical protein